MKPRLKSAPATDEDLDIFNARIVLHGNSNFRNRCDAISLRQDRVDASLMWSMMGSAMALNASTWERRNLLAFWFGDPFCGLLGDISEFA